MATLSFLWMLKHADDESIVDNAISTEKKKK